MKFSCDEELNFLGKENCIICIMKRADTFSQEEPKFENSIAFGNTCITQLDK